MKSAPISKRQVYVSKNSHNRCLSTPVEMYDREVTLDARRRRFYAHTKISFRRSRYIRSFAVVKFYFSGVQGALYTCALSQTGIRYRVRHLDITGDDRDAATGDKGERGAIGRGEGGGSVPPAKQRACTHKRDVRPLSSSAVLRRDKGERRFVRHEIGFCG